MAGDGRFDDELLAIAREHENVPEFIDTLFSFLARRTDALLGANEGQSSKEGEEAPAEQRLRAIVRHHSDAAWAKHCEKLEAASKNAVKARGDDPAAACTARRQAALNRLNELLKEKEAEAEANAQRNEKQKAENEAHVARWEAATTRRAEREARNAKRRTVALNWKQKREIERFLTEGYQGKTLSHLIPAFVGNGLSMQKLRRMEAKERGKAFTTTGVTMNDRMLLTGLVRSLENRALEPLSKDAELDQLAQEMATAEGDVSDGEGMPLLEGEVGTGMNPTAGNGGVGPGYSWSQTSRDLDVRVLVPPPPVCRATLTAKDFDVRITTNNLYVGVRGVPGGGESVVLLEGEMPFSVQVCDCMWLFDDASDSVQLSLQKQQPGWWPWVVKGHPEINLRRLEPETTPMEELDGEVQQTVDKMLYDQKAKAMGLPTSKEIEGRQRLAPFIKDHPEWDFSGAKWT